MRLVSLFAGVLTMTLFSGQIAVAEEPKFTPVQQNSQYVPPKPKEGFRYPDCFCTDSSGKRIELGQTTCLHVGSQSFTARCGMSLNNPTWRRVAEGCPSV